MIDRAQFENLGGVSNGTSAHYSRTIMLSELKLLLDATSSQASVDDYRKAVVENNCLQKDTVETRKISYNKLKLLYSLDPDNRLFYLFRTLYQREPDELALLAYLCAYCRDYVLRAGCNYLQTILPGTEIPNTFFSQCIEDMGPGKCSAATLNSASRNLIATFYKTGHLGGNKIHKVRAQAVAGPASVTYAAAIAYALGERGLYLCDNEFVKALDCSKEKALGLLADADIKGLIRFRHLGEVMDVQFLCAEGIIL